MARKNPLKLLFPEIRKILAYIKQFINKNTPARGYFSIDKYWIIMILLPVLGRSDKECRLVYARNSRPERVL